MRTTPRQQTDVDCPVRCHCIDRVTRPATFAGVCEEDAVLRTGKMQIDTDSDDGAFVDHVIKLPADADVPPPARPPKPKARPDDRWRNEWPRR